MTTLLPWIWRRGSGGKHFRFDDESASRRVILFLENSWDFTRSPTLRYNGQVVHIRVSDDCEIQISQFCG